MSDLIGKKFGQYKIIEEIGSGGMATVYRAHQPSINRDVAIKILPTQFARDPSFKKRFKQEAQAIASLEHVNILPLYDFGTENGYSFMAMRYVPGGTLADLMGKNVPYDRIVHLIGDIAAALDYAHRRGVVHRDIKPSNILIDDQGEALLSDFGIAKLLEGSAGGTRITATGHVLGTPEYVAPEQADDQEIDGRTDIYSLGIVLYELLTGRPPYQANTPLAVVMMHVKDESPPPPRTLKPNIPEPLEQVTLKAMAKNPDERFQTAGEMEQALKQALWTIETSNMTAAPPPQPAPAPGGSSTSPGRFGLVGIVLLLILVGGIAFALFSRSGTAGTATEEPVTSVEEVATAGPTEAANATPALTDEAPDNSTATPQPTATSAPTQTPEQAATPTEAPEVPVAQGIPAASLVGTIAYPVFNGTDYDIFFGQADGSGTEFYEANASQPAFSPDGSRIAFHSWRPDARGLVARDISGSNSRLVSNFPEDQLPTWTADGQHIIFLSRRSGDRKSELIRVSSVEEVGETTLVAEGEYPSVGPNGQLAFKGWGLTGSGLRVSGSGAENVQAVTDHSEDTAPTLSPDGQKLAFMSRRDGNWEIYISNLGGTDLQRLTDDPADDGLPAWSPDGQVLAFVSNRGGSWAIWATTPDGDDQRQLFTLEGSPDGFVGTNTDASRGWTEERISWTP